MSIISNGQANMTELKKVTFALATAGLLSSGVAQAALQDRGGGLLYDTVLNVTWLQDANYAKTSGYDASGLMNWSAANTWAANLVYGGYDDWRLAHNTPVNGSAFNDIASDDGSTDVAFNITSPNSELSFMFYVNLGLKGFNSPSGVFQPDFGVFGDGTTGGQGNVGLVTNLVSDAYWSGTAVSAPAPEPRSWIFFTSSGYQRYDYQWLGAYAWAVRDGDVAAPIPEPETYAMLLAGLGLLGFAARRRKQQLAA